jgi:hypothetical protein
MNESPTNQPIGPDENGRAVTQKRLIQWLVRGTKPDGTRWKSGHRHATRDDAEAEIEQWGPEMGEMKIMRITYPGRHPNSK